LHNFRHYGKVDHVVFHNQKENYDMAKATVTEQQPKAVDTLVAIVDLVIPYRYPDRNPSLSDIARLASAASRVLRFSDLDERIETENRAVLAIAKRRQLVN
jgi:hypothetical protein